MCVLECWSERLSLNNAEALKCFIFSSVSAAYLNTARKSENEEESERGCVEELNYSEITPQLCLETVIVKHSHAHKGKYVWLVVRVGGCEHKTFSLNLLYNYVT